MLMHPIVMYLMRISMELSWDPHQGGHCYKSVAEFLGVHFLTLFFFLKTTNKSHLGTFLLSLRIDKGVSDSASFWVYIFFPRRKGM